MATLKKIDIKKGIQFAREVNLFDELNNIYNNLPSGDCTGCGKCCMESVGTNLIEFLNIYNYLENNKALRDKCLNKVIDYYFLEYIKKSSCPFKDENNKCLIYQVRPLNCRIYGHWTKADYNLNLSNINNKNNEYSRLIKDEYGFEINEEVVNFKINYCEDFKPENRYLKKSERLEFADSLMILDSKLYSSGVIDIEFKDRGIVEYFIESLLFENVAYNIKINVTKDEMVRNIALKRLKSIIL
ncbi:Flagellin N-methylase [[Clostridium] sordellii]|uniref:YkgJ family cysteine cluster protein n=1 Tax=Paraclostridium sordellii TaxID=1505 RepID=UPI0005E03DC4|nr:YkgJ family cysteine cluster protein [Paeniclostridium sordellii]CEN91923.1 Flagellin N-methylase [[Clostridium] sordellii] [Paeniclostridium sordellii]